MITKEDLEPGYVYDFTKEDNGSKFTFEVLELSDLYIVIRILSHNAVNFYVNRIYKLFFGEPNVNKNIIALESITTYSKKLITVLI